MSQNPQNKVGADTGSRARSRETKTKASRPDSSSPSPSGLSGPNGRLRSQLMIAHALLFADEGWLSEVSRKDLGKAVSTFLGESRLAGAYQEDLSYPPRGSDTASGSGLDQVGRERIRQRIQARQRAQVKGK